MASTRALANITNGKPSTESALKKRRIEPNLDVSVANDENDASRVPIHLRGTQSSASRANNAVATKQATGLRKPAAVNTTFASSRTTASVNRSAVKPAVGRAAVGAAGRATGRSGLNSTIVSRESSPDSADKKRKRPAWDVKGRLQDLEEFTELLKGQVRASKDEAAQLSSRLGERESALAQVSETKEVLQQDLSLRQREVEDYERSISDLKRLWQREKDDRQADREEHERRERSSKSQLDTTSIKLTVKEEECERLKGNIVRLTAEKESYESQLADVQAQLQSLIQAKKAVDEELVREKEVNSQHTLTIEGLENTRREHETLRRKLHNTIQELKGNIRVFCRLRPFLGDENADQDNHGLFVFPEGCDKRQLEVYQGGREKATGGKAAGKNISFAFDKVFDQSCRQGDIFEEISQLVQSALDGYNTCIFTYGQTGSGKTFTMEGPRMAHLGQEADFEEREQRGMIPRAVEQIFATMKDLEVQGWSYTMEAFYLEIYNEKIRDLLKTKRRGESASSGKKPKTGKEAEKHEIKHDTKGNTTVTNLTVVPVEAPYQVYDILKKAAHNRSVGKTNKNKDSSRSHSVFQLRLSGINKITGKTAAGVLNLIDLAGSERLNVSGATGDRLTETKNINKSLSCLADVIYSLASRQKGAHIPYRNSKLTYLLQNYLGGNSKTLMFVNISPLGRDISETLSSLRFASQVNACDIGTAKRNIK